MKGIWIQYGCSFFLSLICSMNSLVSVWPSYTIKLLESEQSPLGFKISQNTASLISSIPMLGSLISTLIAGYVSDAIGRKKTQLICGLFYAVAWSLILTARSTFQILFARFLMGLSLGASSVVLLLYNSEITQLSIRGSTSTLASLLYSFGVLVSYLEGWFCSYDLICYINLTCTVIYVVLMCFLKETPTYLLKIGKEKEALSSLKFYRGESTTTEAVLEELSYLKNQGNKFSDVEPAGLSKKEKLQYNENTTNTKKKNCWKLLFTVAHNRRAVISSIIFVILVSSMGMVAVQTYASQFFTAAASTLSPDLCSVIFALILVLSNVLTVLVIDVMPRRALMVSSCLVATICLATLGAAMRWPVVPAWVTLAAVLVYCLIFHLGVISTVFVQLSESYAPQVKSAAAVLVFCFMSLVNFLVLFLFAPAVEYIGIDGTFFVFATIGAFTTVLSYFWIKETKGVPFEQIEKMYTNGFMYIKVNLTES